MFNFIYYGRFSSFDFYGSSAGAQHIDLTKDGITKNILPVIKERGYTQVVSIDDKYDVEFNEQDFKLSIFAFQDFDTSDDTDDMPV